MSENVEIIKTNYLNLDLAPERRAGKWGITGSTLKIIAIITMLIDHFGAVVIESLLGMNSTIPAINDLNESGKLFGIYIALRIIGRIAFPIFCFLLVQGYKHTKNFNKYAIRLLLFALISEVPFDLALFGSYVDYSHQNVFFTLLFGLLAIRFIDKFTGSEIKDRFIQMIGILVFAAIAQYSKTDYGAYGVLAISLLYIYDNDNVKRTVAGFIAFLFEASSITVYIPIILFNFYNGKRGLKLKYFFYLFYPVHFLLLYLLKESIIMK